MSEENGSLVESSKRKTIWKNPYDENQDKYKIISPLIDVIGHQMYAINTCYNVQSYITITESDIAQNKEIVKVSDQVAGILFAAVGYRNHLIDITCSIGLLNQGMEKFLKFYNYSSTPTEFLHYVKDPIEDLIEKVTKLENFSNENYKILEINLRSYLANSGSEGLELMVNDNVKKQLEINKLQKELDELQEEAYNDWIKYREDFEKLVEEVKTLESQSESIEEDLEDIRKQIKDLNEVRGKYEQKYQETKSNRKQFFIFSNDNKVYKDYKNKMKHAEGQIDLMKSQKKEQNKIESQEDKIKKSSEENEKTSKKIGELCDKAGTTSIGAAIELLKAISCLTQQDTNTTSYYKIACNPIKTLLKEIEGHLQTLVKLSGNKEICDMIVKDIAEKLTPIQFVVKIIQPAITKTLQGKSLVHSEKREPLQISYS
ncbi:12573_t:CDS:2 [Funneliformis mosseae]|uniref:12573_t:CDS:1 n=1 Tax=Funneliformis mosseae TaxID=27381 RepID=A0A9N9G6N1_FUNMO|nr:12573_t:CDS:2 [Funneliformis mosseae]